jgi:rod shape-determining protein MreB
MEGGIVLAGGGSLLTGIENLVAQETKMPAYVAEDPLTCVARGCGKLLEDMSLLKRIVVTRG